MTGTPDPEVEWQKDGKPVRDGRRRKVDKGRDGVHSFRIPRSESTDQGEYVCIAKNKAGKITCSAKLVVEGKRRRVSLGVDKHRLRMRIGIFQLRDEK